jgi:RNA polymerase sigma-70 factor, ECF subfamily
MSLATTKTGQMRKPRQGEQGEHGEGAPLGAAAPQGKTAISAILADLHREILGLIPSMRAFARVLTRNQSDADDLVQDTLVKAIGHIDQFTPGTNLRAWLFTIERNTYYTTHQQRRNHAAIPLADDLGPVVAPSQEWSLRVSAVQNAISQLPPEQRDTLLMVAGAGMSYEEAASVCRCALGTIKSRINRARNRLEELLEITGPDYLSNTGD